ncbi:hypothetical protein Ciccas_002471 [Cichlidogyrus casuarinus]|uniref:BTB domain-containing protein n=1 Tax=Cichlidogyrus casuarinus TaxID=1844966 RepID=A0ABD2QH53_9PLAT
MTENQSVLKHYRTSGELSDITIKIEETSFELHKFPLCLRSEFMKEKLKSQPSISSLDLEKFPGGPKNFALIADFVYDEMIEVTPENVAKVLAGAHFLQMNGKNNLVVLCDAFIDRCIKEAKSFKRLEPLFKALIASACIEDSDLYRNLLRQVLDSWLRHHGTCPHSPRLYGDTANKETESEFCEDLELLDYLIYIPASTLIDIIEEFKSTPAKQLFVGHLVANHLGRLMDLDKICRKNELKEVDKDSREEDAEQEKSEMEEDGLVKAKIVKQMADPRTDYTRLDYGKQADMEKYLASFEFNSEKAIDVFNRVFEALTYDASLKRSVDHALLLCQREGENAKCKERIMELSSDFTIRFRPEDLVDLEPVTLLNVISQTQKNDEDAPDNAPELSSSISETVAFYMVEYSRNHELSVEDYVKLLEITKPKESLSSRRDPDTSVKPLLNMAERGVVLDEETKNKVLQLVDLKRCSPEILEQLLAKDLLPSKDIAEAAIYVAKQRSKPATYSSTQACVLADKEAPEKNIRSRDPGFQFLDYYKDKNLAFGGTTRVKTNEDYSVPTYTPSYHGLGKKYSNMNKCC